MPAQNHIHTYVRYKSRPGFYRCDAPNCTHFIQREQIIGKHSLCSLCGQQITLDFEALRRAKPRCLDCSNTKKAKAHRKAQEITRYLGTDNFNPTEIFSQPPLNFSTEPEEDSEGGEE